MAEHPEARDVVIGAHQLVVDIIEDLLGGDGAAPPITVLVDPEPEDWLRSDRRVGTIVVTTAASGQELLDAVRRGADAVVHPAEAAKELPRAAAVIRAGGAHFTPRQARVLADALRRDTNRRLSRREHEILHHIAAGRSVKQTAKELGITPKTVENLQSRLFRKLEVRNRAQAVARGYQLGLLEPAE